MIIANQIRFVISSKIRIKGIIKKLCKYIFYLSNKVKKNEIEKVNTEIL